MEKFTIPVTPATTLGSSTQAIIELAKKFYDALEIVRDANPAEPAEPESATTDKPQITRVR